MRPADARVAGEIEVIELTGAARTDAKRLDEAADGALERATAAGLELIAATGFDRLVRVVTGGEVFEAMALFSCPNESNDSSCEELRSSLVIRGEMLAQMKHLPIRGAHFLSVQGRRQHLLIERARLETSAGPVPMSVPLRAAVADCPSPVTSAPEAMAFLRSTQPIGREEIAAVQLLDEINTLLGNPMDALLDMEVRLWPDGQITLAPFGGFATSGLFNQQHWGEQCSGSKSSMLATKYIWELIEALPEKESDLVEAAANRRRAIH